MLRYALRRVLWAIPTLLATSLVLFFVTTLSPDPVRTTEDPAADEARRTRFLDLPRFLNTNPADVSSRAAEALRWASTAGPDHDKGAEELVRLGGAALPYVLPLLETLDQKARGRVAVALAPVADRMGLAKGGELEEPESAVLFWARFWDDRSLDFTRSAVDRAVTRLLEHGSDLRENDLVSVDTYALPQVLPAMMSTRDHVTLERLTRIAHHCTNRGPVVDDDATAGDVRRTVANWKEWWFVHRTDFEALNGADRAVAFVNESRYGKWLERAAGGELGVSVVDGEPITEKLAHRAPLTLLVCGLAMLLSWGLAVPLGVLGAWRQGRRFDVVSSAVLFLLYATPTFALAQLLRGVAHAHLVDGSRVALAVVSLSVGSLATLSRWQRSAMLEVLGQDFIRTAHAKGLSAWRVLIVHGLRNALLPAVTLAGVHLPVLLGGAFVVEEVFDLPGIGFETLRAIEVHDAGWLMAVVLVCAVAVTLGLVATDIAYGALDPRIRDAFTRRQGGTL